MAGVRSLNPFFIRAWVQTQIGVAVRQHHRFGCAGGGGQEQLPAALLRGGGLCHPAMMAGGWEGARGALPP